MARFKMKNLDWERCDRFLGKHAQRLLGFKTLLVRAGDEFVVQHHGSDILRIRRDNSQVLSGAGMRSSTTKQRLSALSAHYVYQQNWVWYIGEEEFFDGWSTDPEERIMHRACQQDRNNVPIFKDWLMEKGRTPVVYGL